MSKQPDGSERRRSRRVPVLETFSIATVIPKKGPFRLPTVDLSRHGIGFNADVGGEPFEFFPVVLGELLDVHLYLNQSLYIPIQVKIVRIEVRDTVRFVGAEYADQESPTAKAVISFSEILDSLSSVGHLDKSS